MVKVSRLNGKEFYVNSEMVQFIEETPDTVLTFTDGKKLVISESATEFVELVVCYRKKIASALPKIVEREED